MSFNKTINFSTDVASFAIFDPSTLEKYIEAEADWWAVPFDEIEEVTTGQISLISTGSDGSFNLRITENGLTDVERENAVDLIENAGVIVTTGKLYIGDAINMPGGGFNSSTEQSFDFSNGNYKLSIYALNQPDDLSIPDIVVIIELVTDEEDLKISNTSLEWSSDNYLYSAKPQPKLGKKLSGKVWKSPRTESGLVVKDSDYRWPDSHDDYDVLLTDMSKVFRGDKVTFKTIDIDQENDLIIGELISVIPKEKGVTS